MSVRNRERPTRQLLGPRTRAPTSPLPTPPQPQPAPPPSLAQAFVPPPPPPPAPGAPLIHSSRPRSKVPMRRLKPFFWTKIGPTNTPNTVWDELSKSTEGVPIDMKELEDKFALDSSSHKLHGSFHSSSPKANVSTVLDVNRSQNVCK